MRSGARSVAGAGTDDTLCLLCTGNPLAMHQCSCTRAHRLCAQNPGLLGQQFAQCDPHVPTRLTPGLPACSLGGLSNINEFTFEFDPGNWGAQGEERERFLTSFALQAGTGLLEARHDAPAAWGSVAARLEHAQHVQRSPATK